MQKILKKKEILLESYWSWLVDQTFDRNPRIIFKSGERAEAVVE